jgi:hypothetical protein
MARTRSKPAALIALVIESFIKVDIIIWDGM